MVEDSDSEDEEDGGGAEEYEKEQREKLEQERAAIMSDSTLIAEVSEAWYCPFFESTIAKVGIHGQPTIQ